MHRTFTRLYPGLLLLLLLFSFIPVGLALGSYRKAHQKVAPRPNKFAVEQAVASAPVPAAFEFPSVLLIN